MPERLKQYVSAAADAMSRSDRRAVCPASGEKSYTLSCLHNPWAVAV